MPPFCHAAQRRLPSRRCERHREAGTRPSFATRAVVAYTVRGFRTSISPLATQALCLMSARRLRYGRLAQEIRNNHREGGEGWRNVTSLSFTGVFSQCVYHANDAV